MYKYYSYVKWLTMCAMIALLPSCVLVDPASVKGMQVEGPSINKELHAQYIDLSEHEARQNNALISSFFASKARLAARGEPVRPELPEDWNIAPGKVEMLQLGRAKLTVALAETRRVKLPREAAHAQAMFDCWLVETEAENRNADTPACQASFSIALRILQMALNETN